MVSTSIVIPLYGGLDFTHACHAALRATLAHRPEVELVYVDNASPDDTAQWLRSIEHEVTIVSCDTNRGFAGGCNVGVERARGTRIVLLNNDTEVQSGWLEAMEAWLEDPTVGIVGALLTYPDGTVQHAGVAFPLGGLPEHAHVGASPDAAVVSQSRDLQAVTAACCALQRGTWELLGGLDEGYANGMEDMDLCLRARAAGLRVVYEPAARVVHHESRTEGRFRYAAENIERFLLQHAQLLVPDAHVFDRLAGIGPTPDAPRPELGVDVPLGITNEALRSGSGPWSVVAGRVVDVLDVAAHDLDARTVVASGTGDAGWLVASRELVERVGGFDLSLPPEAARVDWLDRVRLFGGHVRTSDPALAAAPWACTDRERDLAGGVDAVRVELQRRWGRCAPTQRMATRYEPLTDVAQVRDAAVTVDVLEHAILLSNSAADVLDRAARRLFEDVAADTSVVVRISPGDDGALEALERAADALDDAHLPDIVVAESGPETELALALACTGVAIFGTPGDCMRLRSIARAAGVQTLELKLDPVVSDQRS